MVETADGEQGQKEQGQKEEGQKEKAVGRSFKIQPPAVMKRRRCLSRRLDSRGK